MSERAGLYLHVPFCASICPYCDFAVSRGDAGARARFTAALVAELRGAGEESTFASFDTIYLGGGTPSFLAPPELEAILSAARRSLRVAADAFVLLEANPEDVEVGTLAAWRGLGIGGVSLGIQSFDGRVLRFLGRRHTGEQARRAVELVLDAGFDWVSIDLLYGSPGDAANGTPGGAGRARSTIRARSTGAAPAGWEPLTVALDDVAAGAALAPHHLSAYQLTVHPGTPFARAGARGQWRELDDDVQATLFVQVHQALAAAGYPAYEVSNFARSREHRSRHNAKYWRHAPYLGLGPAAHSFDGRSRWWNLRDWRSWAAAVEERRSAVAGSERLGAAELALERLMLALRTTDGLDLEDFHRRYGVDLLATSARGIERAATAGLLAIANGVLRPTTRGLAVADALASSLDLGALERRRETAMDGALDEMDGREGPDGRERREEVAERVAEGREAPREPPAPLEDDGVASTRRSARSRRR